MRSWWKTPEKSMPVVVPSVVALLGVLVGLFGVFIATQALRVQAASSRESAASIAQSNQLTLRALASGIVMFTITPPGSNGQVPTKVTAVEIENLNEVPISNVYLLTGVNFHEIGASVPNTTTTTRSFPAVDWLSWRHAWNTLFLEPCSIMTVVYAHPLPLQYMYLYFANPENFTVWLSGQSGTLFQVMPTAAARVFDATLIAPPIPQREISEGRASGCSAG
jgi:hypothetical protein